MYASNTDDVLLEKYTYTVLIRHKFQINLNSMEFIVVILICSYKCNDILK